MDFDWKYINTAILLAVLGYLWLQSKKVDSIHQALFGVNGRNGVLRRLDSLETAEGTVDSRITGSRHELAGRMTVQLGELHEESVDRLDKTEARLMNEIRDLRLLMRKK